MSSLALLYNGSYTFAQFLLNPIKMKFGEILVCLITNMFNMFLAQCWRLGTRSRSYYNFNEMAIWQNLSIFSSWYYPFLIVLYLNFRKIEKLETWLIGYWVIRTGCYIEYGLELSPSLSLLLKDFRYCPWLYLSID